MNRVSIANKVEEVGQAVNALRNILIEEGAVFSAGLTRAAEEALLVVVNSLRDSSVPDKEL